MQVRVDTSRLDAHVRTLQRLHRSALPVAVRTALNSAAFDVKQKTMPKEASDKFVARKPNFFKANSKVEQAQGFDVRHMKSTVGFVPKSGNDKSVDDLEQQEEGGNIEGRSFVPLKEARTGKNWKKNVRAGNRISEIKGRIVDSNKNNTGRTRKEKFTRSAVHAGKGGWVIGNRRKRGARILFSIRSVKRIGKDTVIRAVPMFSVKAKRKVQPPASHFMRNASQTSAGRMNRYFVAAARKQINKYAR